MSGRTAIMFCAAGDERVECFLQSIGRLIDGHAGKQDTLDVLDDDFGDLGPVLLRALRSVRGCGECSLLEGLEPFIVRDEAFRDHADPPGYGLADGDDARLNVVLEHAHEQPRSEILVLCGLGDAEKDGDGRRLSARKRQRNCVEMSEGVLVAVRHARGEERARRVHPDLALDEQLPIGIDLHAARDQLFVMERLDELQCRDSLGRGRIRPAVHEEAAAETRDDRRDFDIEDRGVTGL
jgi:hypothetical protein